MPGNGPRGIIFLVSREDGGNAGAGDDRLGGGRHVGVRVEGRHVCSAQRDEQW